MLLRRADNIVSCFFIEVTFQEGRGIERIEELFDVPQVEINLRTAIVRTIARSMNRGTGFFAASQTHVTSPIVSLWSEDA